MPRLFIAITLSPTEALRLVLEVLDVREPLSVEGVPHLVRLRPARAEALHLTLRFLGETPEGRVDEMAAALRRAVGRAGVGPFVLQLAGVGTFEERRGRAPRVVFAGVVAEGPGAGPLQRLEAAVSDELAALTPVVPRERRAYRPHLTLARVAEARRGEAAGRLDAVLASWRDADLGRVRVEAVELVESTLGPGGARYATRAAVGL